MGRRLPNIAFVSQRKRKNAICFCVRLCFFTAEYILSLKDKLNFKYELLFNVVNNGPQSNAATVNPLIYINSNYTMYLTNVNGYPIQ